MPGADPGNGGPGRDNLRRGIQALTEVHPDSARELRRQEERIDGLEDALGTFLVRLGGRTLTRRDSARAAELLMLIGDLERLGDHAMNLLERGGARRDRGRPPGPPAPAGRTEAVEEIADLALAPFRRETPPPWGRWRPWSRSSAACGSGCGPAHPGNAAGGGGHGAGTSCVVGR